LTTAALRAAGGDAPAVRAQTYIDQYIVAQRQASAALQLLGQFCLQRDALPDPVVCQRKRHENLFEAEKRLKDGKTERKKEGRKEGRRMHDASIPLACRCISSASRSPSLFSVSF
jgi:hypothetical protein